MELIAAQGSIAREAPGGILQGDDLATAFPDVPAPEGSIGIRFRNAQPTRARIVYAEGCNGSPAESTLPFRLEQPRLLELVPGVMPAGVVEAEPVVYIQVLIDPEEPSRVRSTSADRAGPPRPRSMRSRSGACSRSA